MTQRYAPRSTKPTVFATPKKGFYAKYWLNRILNSQWFYATCALLFFIFVASIEGCQERSPAETFNGRQALPAEQNFCLESDTQHCLNTRTYDNYCDDPLSRYDRSQSAEPCRQAVQNPQEFAKK